MGAASLGSSSNWITVHPIFRLLFRCRCWLGKGAKILQGEALEVTVPEKWPCLGHIQDHRVSPGQTALLCPSLRSEGCMSSFDELLRELPMTQSFPPGL